MTDDVTITETNEDDEARQQIEELVKELTEIRTENEQMLKTIQTYGHQPSSASVLHVKIDTILEFFAPDTRLAYELLFEKKMSQILKQGVSEARQASMTDTPNGSGLFIPK